MNIWGLRFFQSVKGFTDRFPSLLKSPRDIGPFPVPLKSSLNLFRYKTLFYRKETLF